MENLGRDGDSGRELFQDFEHNLRKLEHSKFQIIHYDTDQIQEVLSVHKRQRKQLFDYTSLFQGNIFLKLIFRIEKFQSCIAFDLM